MEPVDTRNPADPAVVEALDRLRRGAVEPCVLTLLTSGPAYSHDIVRTLAGVEGMVTSEGTVYPMLSRLRRAGLVQTSWRESPTGPPRRYYELTAQGRHAVSAFAEAWHTFRAGVDQIISGPQAVAPGLDDADPEHADHTTPTRVEETA